MDPAATLSTLASIAVSLIGFSGLISAFGAANESLKPNDVVNIRILLIFSVSALVLALLPLPLVGAAGPPWLWQAFAIFMALFLLFWAIRSPAWMKKRGLQPRRPKLFYGMLLAQLMLALALLAGAVLGDDPALFYCAGVLWCLLIAIVVFVVQIFTMLKIET